ncbi:MAG: hypothetical protein IK088_04330 [Lachnospiraceae bacterium]|nr:hypothetical protein [Lachnospiraceae bacterium]
MNVKGLLENGFREVALPDPEREIEGVYVGDLLSWVMGRCSADSAWITIMTNINILAVATLADPAVIVLSEGVSVTPEIAETALKKNINIVSTDLASYEAAVKLHELLQ